MNQERDGLRLAEFKKAVELIGYTEIRIRSRPLPEGVGLLPGSRTGDRVRLFVGRE